MPQNKSTNTFEQGLIRVDNKLNQPKNSYSYALNTADCRQKRVAVSDP